MIVPVPSELLKDLNNSIEKMRGEMVRLGGNLESVSEELLNVSQKLDSLLVTHQRLSMRKKYVCQLPQAEQDDIRERLTRGLAKEGYSSDAIAESVADAMDDTVEAVMEALRKLEGA